MFTNIKILPGWNEAFIRQVAGSVLRMNVWIQGENGSHIPPSPDPFAGVCGIAIVDKQSPLLINTVGQV